MNMFKVGDVVNKNTIFAAGWMIESFSNQMEDIVFVDETDTMCVVFNGNSDTGVIEKYVCRELI